MAVYGGHFPAGISYNQLLHFAQCYLSKKFAPFRKSLFAPIPPVYPLEKVVTPIKIIWSDIDPHTDPRDVDKMLAIFKNSEADHIPGYNHIDFLWAIDAHKDVYQLFVPFIKKHTP